MFYVALVLSLVGYPAIKSLKISNVNKRKLLHLLTMVAGCSLRDLFPSFVWFREFALQAYFVAVFSIYCLYDDLSLYETNKLKKQSSWMFIITQMLIGGTAVNLLLHLLRTYTLFNYPFYCQLWVGYAFGDGFSGLVGYNWGKTKLYGTLEGSIAFIVAALIFTSLFSTYLSTWAIAPFIILMAIAEQYSPPNLDDLVLIGVMAMLGTAYGYLY